MKFLNRYVLAFAAIAALWTLLFYAGLIYLLRTAQYPWIIAISIGYGILMFLSGRCIGTKDPYNGFLGFNYHLITFIICVAAAWIVHFNFYQSGTAFSMTLFWTIGLLIHGYAWVRLRKGNIRGFDKQELFE